MFLSKYLYYGKNVYYLCPRMTKEDVDYLDKNKKSDKEWTLLRTEKDVYYKTMDDLVGLPSEVRENLLSISEAPLKNGTEPARIYKKCIEIIVSGLKNGTIRLVK